MIQGQGEATTCQFRFYTPPMAMAALQAPGLRQGISGPSEPTIKNWRQQGHLLAVEAGYPSGNTVRRYPQEYVNGLAEIFDAEGGWNANDVRVFSVESVARVLETKRAYDAAITEHARHDDSGELCLVPTVLGRLTGMPAASLAKHLGSSVKVEGQPRTAILTTTIAERILWRHHALSA